MRVTVATERLSLSLLDDDDMAAIRAGDRDGRPWAHDYPAAPDLLLADLAALAPRGMAAGGIWGPWQIAVASGGPVVGTAGFKGPPDADGAVEIGYGLVPSARGHGYATESVEALVDVAARNAASAVTAETAITNTASQNVLRRAGFTAAGPGGTPIARWWRRELRS